MANVDQNKGLGIVGSDGVELNGLTVQAGIANTITVENEAVKYGNGGASTLLNASDVIENGGDARYLLVNYVNTQTQKEALDKLIATGALTASPYVTDEFHIKLVQLMTEPKIMKPDQFKLMQASEIEAILVSQHTPSASATINQGWYNSLVKGAVDASQVTAFTIDATSQDKILTSLKPIDDMLGKLITTKTDRNLTNIPESDILLIVDYETKALMKKSLAFIVSGGNRPSEALMSAPSEIIETYNGVRVVVTGFLPTGIKAVAFVKGSCPAPFSYLMTFNNDKSIGLSTYVQSLEFRAGTAALYPKWIYALGTAPASLDLTLSGGAKNTVIAQASFTKPTKQP